VAAFVASAPAPVEKPLAPMLFPPVVPAASPPPSLEEISRWKSATSPAGERAASARLRVLLSETRARTSKDLTLGTVVLIASATCL